MKARTRFATELETFPAAARRTGLSAKTLKRLAREGAFPTYTCGNSWPRLKRAELDAYVERTRVVRAARRKHVEPGSPTCAVPA